MIHYEREWTRRVTCSAFVVYLAEATWLLRLLHIFLVIRLPADFFFIYKNSTLLFCRPIKLTIVVVLKTKVFFSSQVQIKNVVFLATIQFRATRRIIPLQHSFYGKYHWTDESLEQLFKEENSRINYIVVSHL